MNGRSVSATNLLVMLFTLILATSIYLANYKTLGLVIGIGSVALFLLQYITMAVFRHYNRRKK